MSVFDWFRREVFIEDWTPERAAKHERETLVGLGRVSEPSYHWHRKLLARQRWAERRAERERVRQFRRRA